MMKRGEDASSTNRKHSVPCENLFNAFMGTHGSQLKDFKASPQCIHKLGVDLTLRSLLGTGKSFDAAFAATKEQHTQEIPSGGASGVSEAQPVGPAAHAYLPNSNNQVGQEEELERTEFDGDDLQAPPPQAGSTGLLHPCGVCSAESDTLLGCPYPCVCLDNL